MPVDCCIVEIKHDNRKRLLRLTAKILKTFYFYYALTQKKMK